MTTSTTEAEPATEFSSPRAAWTGLAVTALLIGLAMTIPGLTGVRVYVEDFAPLYSRWDPRVGVGTAPALVLALIGTFAAINLAHTLPWRRLLVVVYLTGLAWMLSLALVDGPAGIDTVLASDDEYLQTARSTTDLPAVLSTYTERIPFDAPLGNWPVHIAGHPPGALVFFVALTRIGLGGGLAAGLVVTALAASTAVAVLVTLRLLGAEHLGRRAAPFLVFGPAAIWACVSADGMFAAVAAWGLAALAVAATRTALVARLSWSLMSGLLLGYTVMLSYGLPLIGLIAVAIMIIARSWRPFLPTALAALAVVLVFAAFGFRWWEAIWVLRERYWDGIAHLRPTPYWIWADLAVLLIAAGPLLGAAVAHGGAHLRSLRQERQQVDLETSGTRSVLWLGGAAVAAVMAADLSLMSKAEVERIWLPFMPWLLILCAFLPEQWRRRGLVLQIVTALVLQHLTRSLW